MIKRLYELLETDEWTNKKKMNPRQVDCITTIFHFDEELHLNRRMAD